jgi:hypothetical protein
MEPREELETIAAEHAALPRRRFEAVERAREAGMTWREIAGIFGMTEHGIIKAQKSPPQ